MVSGFRKTPLVKSPSSELGKFGDETRKHSGAAQRRDIYQDNGKVISMTFNELTKGVGTYAALMNVGQHDHFVLYTLEGEKFATVQPARKNLQAKVIYNLDEKTPNETLKELFKLAEKEDAVHLQYKGKTFGTLLPFADLEKE